jgi:hypothetical protein
MAYISQEKKRELAPKIKSVLARYGMKGTISVDHHSSLYVNIKSGELDVIGNFRNTLANRGHGWDHDTYWIKTPPTYMQVNQYHLSSSYSGRVLCFFEELFDAMKGPDWFDKSDSMSDYFHIAWYVNVNVGKWEKPYQLTGKPEAKSERLMWLEAEHAEKEAA